jgi:hypothetical protein
MKKLRIFLAICAYLLCATTTFAQEGRGRISGTVTDKDGGLVPSAKLTLLNQATGVTLNSASNAAGLYTFLSLNPGDYQLTASQPGFETVVLSHVMVTVDQLTQANVKLPVGAETQTVSVNETTDLTETSNSTVGALFGSEAINELPLLYRNVFDLAQLSAGVTPANGSPGSSDSMVGMQDITTGRPGIDMSSATINGSLGGSVSYMVDGSPIGVTDTNSGSTMPAMDVTEDAVDQVRVETQNTSAATQSGSAGVISVSTKSGTNRIHGDAFGQFRPNTLAANEYFNKQTQLLTGQPNTPPSYHRYQEGAAISGPIMKGKLFYFGDFEATQQEQYEGIDYFSVPTAAERVGNFSALAGGIYDPTQPENVNGTRAQFAGNTITNPNPIGLFFLAKMPQCNLPTPVTCQNATTDVVNNYGVPGVDPYSAKRFDVRIDWAASEKQHIFGRYSSDHLVFSTFDAFPSGYDLAYALNHTHAENTIVGDDITLNPTTLLQLRYSFTRRVEVQGGPAAFTTNNITDQGFPASLGSQIIAKNVPYLQFGDVGQGVGGTADGNILTDIPYQHDIIATINKTLGRHQIATGVEFEKRFMNYNSSNGANGAYSFNISATDQQTSPTSGVTVGGSDYASVLIGMGESTGNSGSIATPVAIALSNPYYGAFFEDTYTFAKSLTVTVGLRWDIFGGPTERHNRLEYFSPNADGGIYTGAAVYANSDNRQTYSTNKTNVSPRAAFAWQPIPGFVIRGGAGFYFGPPTNLGETSTGTLGYSASTPWNDSCTDANGNSVFFSQGCAAPIPGNYTVPYSLSNPFPAGLNPVFSVAHPPTGLGNDLGIAFTGPLFKMPTPVAYNFNFGIEYQLPHEVLVSVGYVGNRGQFLPGAGGSLNELTLAQFAQYNTSLCIKKAANCVYLPNQWAGILPKTNAQYGQPTVPLWFALQNFPQFGTGTYSATSGVAISNYARGDSEYSSLQAKVQKRLKSHFTVLTTFTWGKIMTDDGEPPASFVGTHDGTIQDWKNIGLEHAIAPQDVKRSLNGSLTYELPIGKGRAINLRGVTNAVLGGWSVSGIGYLSTGVPIASPQSGLTPKYFSQRADLTCDPSKGAPHTATKWFNDSCFALPGTEGGGASIPYIAGTAPAYLDHVRTKGAREIDSTVSKTVKFAEAKTLRFEVSSYNLTNTPQLGYPNVPSLSSALSGSSPFGNITNTINTPRQFQFSSRFTF